MRKVATIPEILWGAYEVLDDDIKLSSIIFREPIKNQGQQDIHIDWLPEKIQLKNLVKLQQCFI